MFVIVVGMALLSGPPVSHEDGITAGITLLYVYGVMAKSVRGKIKVSKKLENPALPVKEQVEELLKQAFELHRFDPQQGLTLANQAQELAGAHGDMAGEAEALYTISCCLDTLSRYDDALDYAQRSLRLYEQVEDREGVGKVLNTKGITYQNSSDLARALESFSAARDIYEELDSPVRLATSHNNIGGVHDSVGNYESALEAYLKALQIYEENGQEEYAAMVQYNIGSIHYHLGLQFHDFTDALRYFEQSKGILERLESDYSLALTLNGLASVYIAREEYDQARAALTQASEIFEKIGELRLKATTLLEIGIVDEKQKKYATALRRYQQAAQALHELHVVHDYGAAQYHIGNLHYDRGRYTEALEALSEGLRALQEAGVTKMEKEIRWIIAMICRETGDLEGAVEHMVLHQNLANEQFRQERQEAIAKMQARFDVERAEREREVFRLRADQMEELAEQRSKELSTTAMHLVAKNNLLQSLRKDLLSLLDQPEQEAKQVAKDLFARVEESLRFGNDWKRFEEMYQLVHHNFIQRLSEQYTSLSSTELKVCALMKISLSNSEIADLLCVSDRTIESHRYRIRKKLGLSSSVNLGAYMSGI